MEKVRGKYADMIDGYSVIEAGCTSESPMVHNRKFNDTGCCIFMVIIILGLIGVPIFCMTQANTAEYIAAW